MTRRQFALICCAVAIAPPLAAQSRTSSRPAKADALTGKWKGELSDDTGRQLASVTLDLKFDGKRSVTGTMIGLPNPGDVKRGTFDPATGALELRMGKSGEDAVLIVLEGTVTRETATGRVSGEAQGTFKLTKQPA